MIYHACTGCGSPFLLLARMGGGRFWCADCWRGAGRPDPLPETADRSVSERAIHDRMWARGVARGAE